MPQPSKEPCKKEACDIQACLSKNNFIPQRKSKCNAHASNCPQVFQITFWCLKVIEKLEYCCGKCDYKSTHCGSLSGLLKQKPK